MRADRDKGSTVNKESGKIQEEEITFRIGKEEKIPKEESIIEDITEESQGHQEIFQEILDHSLEIEVGVSLGEIIEEERMEEEVRRSMRREEINQRKIIEDLKTA